MTRRAALGALAAVSLGLTVLRYGDAGDRDAGAAAALAARLAAADFLPVAAEATPAFRVLHLRRPGCTSAFRLAIAPDDGEAAPALARLLPGAPAFTAPDPAPNRPDWLIVAEARRGDRCADLDELRAALAQGTR